MTWINNYKTAGINELQEKGVDDDQIKFETHTIIHTMMTIKIIDLLERMSTLS